MAGQNIARLEEIHRVKGESRGYHVAAEGERHLNGRSQPCGNILIIVVFSD